MNREEIQELEGVLLRFIAWLDTYGETSYDYQSFFASPLAGKAKMLYYRNRILGILAVSPMVFCEAFLPSARRFFWHRQRFPIADAHFAMGFATLGDALGESRFLDRAVHFLEVLLETRSPGYERYGWGYPFGWGGRGGIVPPHLPLITSTPYVYEAFDQVYRIDGNERWLPVMRSIADFCSQDIAEIATSGNASCCGYSPGDTHGGVVNASAYRAFLLTAASIRFSEDVFRKQGERNLRFVLEAQRPDGSWFYSVDGARDFVDHFHTCFVIKALAKIEQMTGHEGCRQAIERGLSYYLRHLFDEDGLPRPFSRAPRLTIYKKELYDYAECLNLCALLRRDHPELTDVMSTVTRDLFDRWAKADGSFRTRKLYLGWDNVPLHRWAQSQLFRSLCLLHAQEVAADR